MLCKLSFVKHLLTLLLFISTSVYAGICYVNTEAEKGAPGFKYTGIIGKKIDDWPCKKKDILHVSYLFGYQNPSSVASSIFNVMAKYCNFDKNIEYDLKSSHLVCEFKRNY